VKNLAVSVSCWRLCLAIIGRGHRAVPQGRRAGPSRLASPRRVVTRPLPPASQPPTNATSARIAPADASARKASARRKFTIRPYHSATARTLAKPRTTT
jgi:hypothetical protein